MTLHQETEYLLHKFSHELRNPLTSLYSTVQLVEMKYPEVKDFKYWSNLNHDIEYMNILITELSDFTKSNRLNLSTFSLRALLEQTSLSFAAMVADSQIEFRSKIDPSIHQITGDKTKIQEVFRNLLKNALDAAMPDKTIYLEALSLGNEVLIRIQDTGCGIDSSKLPTIFDPFVTYKKNGTGLGLSICDQIVKAHKGKIAVKSEVSVGTTFEIYLPVNLSLL